MWEAALADIAAAVAVKVAVAVNTVFVAWMHLNLIVLRKKIKKLDVSLKGVTYVSLLISLQTKFFCYKLN